MRLVCCCAVLNRTVAAKRTSRYSRACCCKKGLMGGVGWGGVIVRGWCRAREARGRTAACGLSMCIHGTTLSMGSHTPRARLEKAKQNAPNFHRFGTNNNFGKTDRTHQQGLVHVAPLFRCPCEPVLQHSLADMTTRNQAIQFAAGSTQCSGSTGSTAGRMSTYDSKQQATPNKTNNLLNAHLLAKRL